MIERYYQELVGFFSRTLGDRDSARDLVHEAYARMLAMPGAATVQEPRAFLYRTARNLAVDQYRRAAVRQHEALEPDELHAPEQHRPEQRYEAGRRTQALLTSIDALPPRCREAFVLHKFDGLPQAEVAQRMGVTVNMVEKHVIRAVMACRRALDALEGDRPDTPGTPL